MGNSRVRSLAHVVESAFGRALPRTRVRVVSRARLTRALVDAGIPAPAAARGLGLTTRSGTILVRADAGGRTLLHELVHRMGRPGAIHPWIDEAVTEAAAGELAEAAARRWPEHATWLRHGRGYAREVAWLRRRVLRRLGGGGVDLARTLTASTEPPALLATRLVVADPALDHGALVRALQPRFSPPRGPGWAPPRVP